MIIVLIGCGGSGGSGSSSYIVTVDVNEGGMVYKEVVTEVLINNVKYGTTGKYQIELEEGDHTLTWSYANINGLGQHLNERTKVLNFEITGENQEIIIYGGLAVVN